GVLREHRRDGGVGREAQHDVVADVADVIAALRDRADRLSVVLRRPAAHADARMAREPLHAPHDHHRAENPAVVLEARREIGDLHRAPRRVRHAGDDDRRVVLVALLGFHDIEQVHREESDLVPLSPPRVRFEQRAEHRIAVEPRETGPGDLAGGIDQGPDGPVADQREIERSQYCTASTFSSRHRAIVFPAPTLIECPPSWLTDTNPNSSLASSPTNTGVRPANGGSRMNSSTASPLSFPAGFSSTTLLPVCTQYSPPLPTSCSSASIVWYTKPASPGVRR